MSDQEILKKAIEKAKKNGYDFWGNNQCNKCDRFIFTKDFAKAFWGEKDMWKETKCDCGGVDFHLGGFDMHHEGCSRTLANRGYKFHLGQMVLEENPIKYLEQFL